MYRRSKNGTNLTNNIENNNNNQSSSFRQTSNLTTDYSSEATNSLATPVLSNINSKMNISCRDRTSEFHSTIRSFQSRMSHNPVQTNSNSNNQKNTNKEVLQRHSKFTLYAKKIGKDLSTTCIKLEKLTDLAKKRTLFEDRSKEIHDLTFHIKQDINNLHSAITQLQAFVKSSQDHGNKNLQKHSNNVVYTLQSKLAYMSKDFKQVLEVRNENMKQQSERGEQFFSKNTLNTNSESSMFQPPKMPGSNMGKSVLLYDGNEQSHSANENGSGGNTILNMDIMAKQQAQQSLILTEDNSYIQDRANAMQTVETTIVELGTMFNQLATMIKEQEEQITRIDSNVDDIDMNVNAAHTELLKYFQSVTSNRWLMIKVFGVLIVFFIIFIVVMT